ncbi:flagellar type III secretion system pore protein FliP [Paraburkholderia ferrariae]|uniref:Flagellar biosynthetic protein FliP n=2 Tax=Paraburkholderia ferrariae TaxID=386056 RepID=A0ABU9RMF0_9BURK
MWRNASGSLRCSPRAARIASLAGLGLAALFMSGACVAASHGVGAGPASDSVAGALDALGSSNGTTGSTALALRVLIGLTLVSLIPALLVSVTSFLRIVIVLSMLRQGLGMQETPPNSVLIGLALFMTLFTMAPVLEKVDRTAFEPFMAGQMSMQSAYQTGMAPLREFMIRQTREQDLALMIELAKAPVPEKEADVSNVELIPAFMLSELRTAFQIGFVILLPFLLIDLIVSSILMALGMMMMPPATISLPIKVLMFVLVDGWELVVKALVGSFH